MLIHASSVVSTIVGMDHKPSRPCTVLFVMLRSECDDSSCTRSIKGNARTLSTERLSIFVSGRVRGSGFNGDLASDFSNVQAVPRVRLQCKVAPGSGRERAGMVGEQGAAHAAREKTFESANQATKLVTNLPCSQERPPAGRAGGQQGAHQRQPPSAPPRCGWWAPWGRATIATKDRKAKLRK